MKKSDIIIALITGELTAWYFIYLFRCSAVFYTLLIIFPILGIICLWLAYLVGKKFLFVFQLAKFCLTGSLAALFDLAILNVLILVSGITAGITYSVFKGISFIISTCSKYAGDKLWAFEQTEKTGIKKEFSKFFIVTLGGFLINVISASLVVNQIGPQFGLSKTIWANIGAIIAALATVAWNFPAYKFLVFKK